MSQTFQNPRNPLAALWASAAEAYLRKKNPDLNIQDIRRLPVMRGVYEHLSQLGKKKRITQPATGSAKNVDNETLRINQIAFLSQSFFELAVTTAAFSDRGEDLYDQYIALLNSYNSVNNIGDFSTDDVVGFALCLIVWVCMASPEMNLSTLERELLDYLIDNLPISDQYKHDIREFWDTCLNHGYSVQYRDASAYPNYQAIPWKIPADAQIILLGDWGTSLDDAHEFLYAIWKKAYQNNPGGTIVFLHLGDIYYCGLPYECQNYFYNVFVNVGQRLQAELNNSNFDPNPPIFTIPGNHEYYSFGYGYFELLDTLNRNTKDISHSDIYQQCSFFCLQTADSKWQFLGMDTGQADGNGLTDALEAVGDAVKNWLDERLPDWSWLTWATDLAKSTYDDYVGPFQPTLRTNELNWLKNKMDTFSGKTILLSHHQLYSREAEINHNSPEYMNTWLDDNFSSYYTNKVAAWYWGHEHTFATYLDGIYGLNKGRLLGSSSYESTQDGDTPYANNYPAVPYADNMTDTLVHKNSDGLYYHAGAIMSQNGSSMSVKYYQFPAWTQLDTPPSNPQLEEMTTVAEDITTSFKSLRPSWIGNQPISQDKVTTDHSPSITSWNDMLYMIYSDGSSNSKKLTICTANAADYQPESNSAAPAWSDPSHIKIDDSNVTTGNSPAVIAVNGKLYGFYIDGDKYIQGITANAGTGTPSTWSSIGKMPNEVNTAGPAVCFFQGRIYVVYRESGSSNNLCWAYYDIAAGTWQDFGKLKDSNGDNFESDNTPAIAADAYHIYMTYQKKNDTDICWAVGTPDSNIPNGTANNISWTDNGKIQSIAKDGTTNPDTNLGMSLEYANGVFFLVYPSTNNNLTQCALNGTGADSTGTWVGCNTVKVNVNTSKSSKAQSSHPPSLAVTSGGGFLVYRGNQHDEIYWAYY